QRLGLAVLLVTHDLGVVAQTCARVAVMYAGSIMETAGVTELFEDPRHPYTAGLLASIPNVLEPDARLQAIPGTVPRVGTFPEGCRFAPRCPHSVEHRCTDAAIPIEPIGVGRACRCTRVAELTLTGIRNG